MLTETIQLETLRQKIEDAEFEAGDKTDYLSYGKPGPVQAKQTKELIEKLKSQSKELRAEFTQLIATTRSQQPQAFGEWVKYHIDILQKIIDEKSTDKNAPARRNVAKETIQQWEKVHAGEQEYVNINWHFLKDYKAEVRTITGGTEPAPHTNQTVGDTRKSKSWWPFGK